MERMKMRIDGMTCGHCVSSVRKALEAVDGTSVEDVDIGSAVASYDPAVTSIDSLKNAVSQAGFEVAEAEAA